MVLSQSVLASELEVMVPVGSESEGIDNFANAFETYFYDSEVATIPVNPDSLLLATEALKAAMVGASSDAATAIQNGITAFWTWLTTGFVSVWTTTPPLIALVPPIGLSSIASSLNVTFNSNISGELGLEDCASAIAATLHVTQLGGIATIGPPPPAGTPTPIL